MGVAVGVGGGGFACRMSGLESLASRGSLFSRGFK